MNPKEWHIIANGLDPQAELPRHEGLEREYRAEMAAMGRKRNWRWRDFLGSAIYQKEQASALRKEGIGHA